MTDLVVIGTGPHSEMCAAVIRSTGQWNVLGHVAPDGEAPGAGPAVVGHDVDLPALLARAPAAFVGIGDNAVRQRMSVQLVELGFTLPAVVAPSAIVADEVTIGDGVLVAPGAIINTLATIGAGGIVNTGAVVEHHVAVGPFAHVAPNSTLCGCVQVDALALVGAGAVVLPGVQVGEGAVVAAGSAAPRDVAPHAVSGIPARRDRA